MNDAPGIPTIAGLRCEHLVSPHGVASRTPLFTWYPRCFAPLVGRPEEAVGSAPEATADVAARSGGSHDVRIEICSLLSDDPIWWTITADTGRYRPDALPIESMTRYRWRVVPVEEHRERHEGTTGQDRNTADGTDMWAEFSTGLVDDDPWPARWIGPDLRKTYRYAGHAFTDVIEEEYAAYLQGAFSIGGTWREEEEQDGAAGVTRSVVGSPTGRAAKTPSVPAVLMVAAMGAVRVVVNGADLDDAYLDPPATDYRKRVLYRVWPISVVPGDTVTVDLLLGNGRALAAYGMPRPAASAVLAWRDTDGSLRTAGTDDTWRWRYGAIGENGVYRGEVVASPLLNDASHRNADSLAEERGEPESHPSTRSHPASIPWRTVELRDTPPILTPALVPPVRLVSTLHPISIKQWDDRSWLVDFGQNMSGVVSLSGTLAASVPDGEELKLTHAEHIDRSGGLDTRTNRAARQEFVVRHPHPAVSRYRPKLTTFGFRHIRLDGPTTHPMSDELCAHHVTTDVAQSSSFSSSDAFLERLHEVIVWGQRSNMIGVPTDCPQRDERHGWLGDAHLIVHEALLNFDAYHFFAKFLDDIADAQRSDGALCDVAPAFWPLTPADPAWGTAYAEILWYTWWHRGDESLVQRHLAGVERYVRFLLGTRDDDGIIRSLGKYGDWCPPGSIFSKRTPVELTSTWFLLHDLDRLSQLARVVDDASLSAWADDRRAEVVYAFNRAFLTERGYAVNAMSPRDTLPGQTSNLLPLAAGIVPDDARDRVVDALVTSIDVHHDRHLDTGIVGTRYLFEVLTNLGYHDIALDVAVAETYPGYRYMLDRGATTLWERWEELRGKGMNSHNHIMLGSIDTWLHEYVAGMRAVAPVWRVIEYEPFADVRISSGATSTVTPRGRAAWSWRRSAGRLLADAEVPPGTTGRLIIPGVADLANLRVEIDGTPTRATAMRRGTARPYGAATVKLEPGVHTIHADRIGS